MLRATIPNEPTSVPFTVSLTMQAAAHKKPVCAGTSHNNFCALGHHKNTFCVTVSQSNYGFI